MDLEYADLFQNEVRALSLAERNGVPRVIKFIEGARTTDDICLILEYVWRALQKLYRSCALCTFGLYLHALATNSFIRAGWCVGRH